MRLILLGIDGATWNKIHPLIEEGHLPNFHSSIQQGSHGDLRSTNPPISPSAWTSIFTGVNPGKHNIFGFTKRKPDSYFVQPISSKDRLSKPIWQILSDAGIRSIFLNIPFSYPPDEINGIMTCGLGTPSKKSNFSYPTYIKTEIISKYQGYNVDFDEDQILLGNNKDPKDLILKVNSEIIESSKDLFLSEKWDVFSLVLRSTDVIQHYYWSDDEAISDCYKQVDSLIGWVMEQMLEEDVLMICSDHGFTGIHTRVNFNQWLSENGFLTYKKSVQKSMVKRFLPSSEQIHTSLLRLGMRNVVSKLKRSNLVETSVRHLIRSERMDQVLEIDWENTRVFFRKGSYGLIDINIKDQNPMGIVDSSEISQVVKELKEKSVNLVDPNTGNQIITKIEDGRKVFLGNLRNIPSIVLTNLNGYRIVEGRKGLIFEKEREKEADHSLNGIIIMYGKKINKNIEIFNSSVNDITPTILYLLGINPPKYMDGSPLKTAIVQNHLIQKSYRKTSNCNNKSERDRTKKAIETFLKKKNITVKGGFKNG